MNACFGDSWENILKCWIEIEEPPQTQSELRLIFYS